ncbi:MAG: hypothetical protein LBD37_05900 [Treponema sp.]|jgi:hypothetical protein|nr:hypothetical protein [Treponema sp.]
MERESSLHRALKFHYSGGMEQTEQHVDGYVCDGITGSGEIIEVQTGNFGCLKKKIPALAERFAVRIIHPIIIRKKIKLYSPQGGVVWQRQSPRKGTAWDLFNSLIYTPQFPLIPSLTIELALVDMLERRIQDGKGSWRRKGVSIGDKLVEQYHQSIPLKGIDAYDRFVPFQRDEEFTVKDLSGKAGIPASIARKTLYVLTILKAVTRIGKAKNAWVYQKNNGRR